MKIAYGALALSLVLALPASAQQAIVIGAPQGNVLRAGTEVPMKMSEELTTLGKHLKVGQRFEVETAEPISLNGRVVIPAGTHGTGEVTSVRNKGMWGKSGNIEARVLYLRAGDRQIRMSGTLNDKGVTGTGAVVGSVVLLPLAGFFMTGTSARIPTGAPVKAFLDEDVPVTFADAAPDAGIVVAAAQGISAAPAVPQQ
ncbi:hypothetical protein ACSBM8_18540 [Sphingomonas sp. ASY06-1R]|uniref:hypothetical protein n=1 Tax=Sphingomonas sp. ASY06-1R TaxID=3445771 RepID=UPI003FA1F684